jgi:predicted DNA-binding protein (MmcQ/YjbR family)
MADVVPGDGVDDAPDRVGVVVTLAAALATGATSGGRFRWHHPAMDAAGLRRHCLSHRGAVETFPFGPEHSVFKVAGKIFALTALDRTPLQVSLKCDPDLAVELRATYAAVRPGYHLNKRHWNTVTLDGSLPDQLVCDLIEDSYDLVVSACPRRVREQLGWALGPD